MGEEKIGFFTQMKNSIADFSSYRYFAKRSLGKAFLYLLLITLFFGSISIIRSLYYYNIGVRYFINQAPNFELKNGQLTVYDKMPIIHEENGYAIIVDTTDTADKTMLSKYSNGIFISKDSILVRENNTDANELPFSDFKNTVFTKNDLVNFIPAARWIIFIFAIFALLGFYISKMFSALIVSIIGLIISGITGNNVSFEKLYKLSIYALTLSIAVKVIIGFIPFTVPFFAVIYYGIASYYLWRAINIIKKENDEISGVI